MSKIIKEAAGGAGALTGSRSLITLITPGWGSSGYYSTETLAKAAEDKVFPAGTQMHIDHSKEDGVGSVSTLAAVLAEDARWEPNWKDPKTGVKGRLAAENKVFSNWQQPLADMAEHIGVSIASAAEMSLGEAEGQQGRIIEALLPSPLNRVDYVTVAGRGGHISEVLESAQGIIDRAVAQGVAEATANDVREWLSKAVRETYGGSNSWAWLRDYDETNVWFELENADGTSIQQDTYQLTDDGVTLSGSPIEVRIQTSYVPVSAATAESKDSPPDPAGVTEGKEPVMGTVQIEESVHADLVEKSSRVSALESELKEARDKLAAAESATVTAKAEAIVAEAFGDLEAKVTRRSLVAAALAAESFNAEALKADAEEAAAELRVATGEGTPRGVGHSAESAPAEPITAEKAQEAILASSGYTPKGAK